MRNNYVISALDRRSSPEKKPQPQKSGVVLDADATEECASPDEEVGANVFPRVEIL